MTLINIIKSDLVNLFFSPNDFATEITYTPPGGYAVTRNALIDYGVYDYMPGGMDSPNTEAELELIADDTNGVALVVINATVTIGTDTWKIVDPPKKIDDGLIWRCHISRINR